MIPGIARLTPDRLPARADESAQQTLEARLKRKKPTCGKTCLTAGLALVFVLLAAIIILPMFATTSRRERPRSCANNLKQMGLICMMYAFEHDGVLPPLAAQPGVFLMDPDTVYPDFWNDIRIAQCPEGPDADVEEPGFEHNSYVYLGYALRNEREGRAFLEAYRQALRHNSDFVEDLPLPAGFEDAGVNGVLPRLNRHLEEKDDYSRDQIPVMFDRSFDHHRLSRSLACRKEPGIYVLYLNGHVEFIWEHENRFPAVQWFLDELEELSRQQP